MANKQRHDWSKYNSIEAIQEFIDQNNIENHTEFKEKFSGLEKRVRKLGFKFSEFKFKNPKHKWAFLKTKEEIESYIIQNNIIQFSDLDKSLRKRIRDLGFSSKNFNFKKSKKDWSLYNSLEDIQKFIDENNVRSCSEFDKNFSGLSNRTTKLGISLSNLKFPEINKRNYPTKWSDYNSLDDIQKFIDGNNIKSCSEFSKKFSGLSNRTLFLGFSLSDLEFPERFKSSLESNIESFLIKNNINFIKQKIFKDLGNLRFDFFLPDYNLILEPGGDQHFIPIKNWGGDIEFEKGRKRDKLKFEYCNNKNIKLLYYFKFYRKQLYDVLEKDGYMGEWYIDFDKFTNRILEIIKNGKS